MATDSGKDQLTTLDMKEIKSDTQERKGFFSGLVNDMKSLLGIPLRGKGPNVKAEILEGQEREVCLSEIPLKKGQKIVSDLYRVLEFTKELAPDGELIAPVEMSPESVAMHVFHFWMKTDNIWEQKLADFQDDGCAHGPLVKMDVFCVVAELKCEEITVGPVGFKYVSDVDNRVTVDFPPGALEKANNFQITLDVPNVDRYKAYREYLPHMFDFVAGLSLTLKVDHDIKQSLKKKATVSLPVDRYEEADSDWDVVFFSWQEETVDILGPGKSSENNAYCIDVSHFSDVNAYRVRPAVPMQTVLEAAKYLSGQISMCTLLTFIAFNHIETMPALVCDCVESIDKQPEKRAAEYKQMGLHEVRLSRSRDIPMENNCRIKVELGGNLKLGPKVSPSVLNMHFLQYSATNRVVVPVKRTLGQQPTSSVTYRGPKNRWEHPVYFQLSPDQCSRNLKPDQTRVPSFGMGESPTKSMSLPNMTKWAPKRKPVKRNSVTAEVKSEPRIQEDKPQEVSVPVPVQVTVPILSQQSLNALSDVLTTPSDWRRIGIELGIRNDDITRIFKSADMNNSLPAIELLLYWQRNTRRDAEVLVNNLASAFSEIDRGDVAEKIYSAFEEGRRLTRDDVRAC